MQLIIITLLLLLPSFGMRKQVLGGKSRRSVPLKENIESLNNYLVLCGIVFLVVSIYCFIVAIKDKNILYFALPLVGWLINYTTLVSAIKEKKKIRKI